MTTQPMQFGFTSDEFLAWADEQPSVRHELVGGVPVAMAPERIAHARAKLDVAIALSAALARRGLPCEAMIDGVGVRIDDLTVFVPDVMVRCGTRTPGDVMAITDPVIVVEVLSPTTRAIDSGIKLTDYFRLPSVRHYLVVNTDARLVTHHRRDDTGAIATQILGDGTLELEPPGIFLDVEGFFAAL